MSETSVLRETAFDPFGEPLDGTRTLPEARPYPEAAGYRETRRAALVFWALALMIVGIRIYLSDVPAPQAAVAGQASAALRLSVLR